MGETKRKARSGSIRPVVESGLFKPHAGRLSTMDFIRLNEKEAFNYQKIKPELLNLFEATANKIEREWDKRYPKIDSAQAFFTELIPIATNTYGTIVYICADTPDDIYRKPQFILSSAPLVRSLFEELI